MPLDNKTIAFPQSGMNRDKHPSSLTEQEYTFAMNANIESEDGNVNMRSSEHSTLRCIGFEGFKVIGYKNDLSTGMTYFFLTNPETKVSKVAYYTPTEDVYTLSDDQIMSAVDGTLDICENLKTLIEDSEDDPCLNFSIYHPIKTIEIKVEKCGKCIYWTDNYNPPRYVIVEKALEPDEDGDIWYHYHGYKLCGERNESGQLVTRDEFIRENGCVLACEKLRVFPLLDQPCIEPVQIEYGGSLRAGVYQFAVALCDEFGNEKTNYTSLTNPVHIFDKQYIRMEDGKWGARTNLGIRLVVSNLDRQVNYFKVAVIQNTVGYNGETQPVVDYFIEGIHPITEKTILYYSDLNNERTTFEHIAYKKAVYNTSRGIVAVGNRLLQYGLTAEKEWNLQPVVSLMGHFLKWQASVAHEDLYKDGNACSLYVGYMRDEVYPFSISFRTSTGYKTPIFTLIPPPSEDARKEAASDPRISVPVESVNKYSTNCYSTERKYIWQYSNNAGDPQPIEDAGKFKYIYNAKDQDCNNETTIGQTITVEKNIEPAFGPIHFEMSDINVSDVALYISENMQEIACAQEDNPVMESICDLYKEYAKANENHDDETLQGYDGIEPPEFPESCDGIKRDESILSVPYNNIKNIKLSYSYVDFEDMLESSKDYIYSAGGEVEEKYSYFFDSKTIDYMRAFVDKVYKQLECADCMKLCDEAMMKREPEALLAGVANNIKVNVTNPCTCGCNINSPCKDPIIRVDGYTLFQPSSFLIRGFVYQYNAWCGNSGSGSSTTTDDCYLSKLYPNICHEEFWPVVESESLNFAFIDKFNTGLETEWEWTRSDVTSSNWDMTRFEAADRDNGRFDAGLAQFKFFPKIGRNASWIEISRPNYWEEEDSDFPLVLESFGKTSTLNDGVSTSFIRVSFWKDLDGTPLNVPSDFLSDRAKYSSSNSRIFNVSDSSLGKLDRSFFDSNNIDKFYISLDTPLMMVSWYMHFRKDGFCRGDETSEISNAIAGVSYVLAKTQNSYVVGIRDREIDKLVVDADSLTVRATVTYSAQCVTCGDSPINCAPRQYMYGDFAYWESSEKYPANYELYDSSRVRINTGRTYEGDKAKAFSEIMAGLQKYYGSPSKDSDGMSYFTGHKYGTAYTSTVFCQQPIRHYKFPDNYHMPFMSSDMRSMGISAEIYPVGIMVNEEIIQVFLDFAVDSGLITQEQRDTIVGYELYRGDRRLNRSIVASGLSYDMFKYTDDNGNANLYPNYPYNDLSDDQYNYIDGNREQYIKHPFPLKGNVWYSFVSPDIYFNKFELPTEVLIDGYHRGMSVGGFTTVEEHPKWTILGPKAYSMAKTLANIESTATIASIIAEELQVRAQSAYVGVIGNLSVAMLLTEMVRAITRTLAKRPMYYGKYRYDWLNTFINNGPRLNYAWYYASVGYYNSMTREITEEGYYRNSLRGLSVVKEIKSGIYPISDGSSDSTDGSGGIMYINNIDRESSIFLSFGEPGDSSAEGYSPKFMINYPQHVSSYDNSRVDDPCIVGADTISGKSFDLSKMISYIASPYMRLRRYKPDQYGSIEDINWISIGGCGKFSGGNKMVFGGDTFISRFSMKRKFPFFYNNAFHIGDMIPFPYNDYRNVGYPKYFVNYDTGEDALEHTDNESFGSWTSAFTGVYSYYPNRVSLYNLNAYEGDKYVRGRFYLWMYGIPQFLVESEINCNFRLEGEKPEEQFYPAVGDYVWWTQEKNVSIQRDNDYKISPIYFSRSTLAPNILPATYERKFYDCAYQRPNGVIWSRKDVSENSQTDPWLTYKPLDYHEFPAKNGRLIHMKCIESEQILARFEDQVSLHNAIDVIRERTSGASELGTGGLFSSRALEYNTTDLGYSGTQSTEMISSEFGHFWVDVKRAQVFMTDPNGRNLQELSIGIRHWLKKHLPFKILKYGITNVATGEPMTYEDVDNKFIGLGLSLGWDNRYKRVFITKKDYIPVKEAAYYKYDEGKFTYNGSEVSLKNTEYFEDVSFTLAYSCLKKEWISYYSFCPDYYIEQQSHFQSGLNYSSLSKEEGLWSHLLTNKSFQTFYGTTYPFILEVPLKESYSGNILTSVEYELDARKYISDVDYTLDRKVGLDSIVIYNDTNNSGELRLVPEEKNNLMQKVSYPKVGNNYTEILDTEVYRRHKLNDFFNRVDDDRSGVPIWVKDENDIMREVNPDALNFRKNWLDRMRGSWMLMRIKKVISDTKIIFQWIIGEDKRKNR